MIEGFYWEQAEYFVKAEPATIFIVVAALSAATAAYFLLMPNKGMKNPLDDSKSEPSVRGTIASFLLGRMRVGPVIGYVGDRKISKEKSPGGGGGKGGGGGGDTDITIYNEMGMHIISTGEGTRIRAIYQAGKNILQGEISSAGTPSGSAVSLGKEGTFRVYWGKAVQPVDTRLASMTGLSSTFPHIFYLVWDRKRLGQQSIWPQLEYDVEVTHPADLVLPANGQYLKGRAGSAAFSGTVQNPVYVMSLVGYSSILSTGETTPFIITTSDTLVQSFIPGTVLEIGSLYSGEVVNVLTNGTDFVVMMNKNLGKSRYGSIFSFTFTGVEYSGVNPASALFQMFFSGFPHGLNWAKSRFNLADFDTLANLFRNVEISPCTIMLRSGKSFKDAIASIMQDFGIVFFLETPTGKLRFKAIRTGDTPTAIAEDDYQNDELARTFGYATLNADKTIFSFKDSARKFADATILYTNDSGARYSDNPNTKKVTLYTITDFTTASMIASRREQESSMNEILVVKLSQAYVDAQVGDLFTIATLAGDYRLLKKEIAPDEASLTASFALDAYSITNNFQVIQGTGGNPVGRIDPSADIQFNIFETNRLLSRDQNGFFASRIRFAGYILGSQLFASPDDTTYALVETLDASAGGSLSAELGLTSTLLEDGVFIDVEGEDITNVQDFIGSEELWRGGAQVAFIGAEICFLQGINVGTGELIGLIRARAGTQMQVHPIGTPVFIAPSDSLTIFSRSFLTPGVALYAKSLPFTTTAQVPPDEVDAVNITYGGGGFRPLPCTNLTTEDGTKAWIAGTNVPLRWSYRNATDTGASGLGLSGEVSTAVPPEGTFKLEILNGSTVVRTVEQAGTEYTYTNAQIVADFGSAPATFNARVVEVLNGLTSIPETATITRI